MIVVPAVTPKMYCGASATLTFFARAIDNWGAASKAKAATVRLTKAGQLAPAAVTAPPAPTPSPFSTAAVEQEAEVRDLA